MRQRDLQPHITMSGTVLFACMVAFWIFCAASRALRPDSTIGAFLSDADGVLAVIVASVLFGGIAGAILEKLGYPIVERATHNK